MLAARGAFALEDMGILEIDRMIGSVDAFGALIRETMIKDGVFNEEWSKVALRLKRCSPGTSDVSSLLGVLCVLCTTHLFIEGRFVIKTGLTG